MKDVTNSSRTKRFKMNHENFSFKDIFQKSDKYGTKIRWLYLVLAIGVTIYYYVALPAIHYAAPEFWMMLFVITLIVIIIESLADGMGLYDQVKAGTDGGKGFKWKLPLKYKLLIYPWPILLLVAFVSNLIFSPIFMADSFANMIKIETKDFSKDFPETDMDHITLVDRDTAERLGDRQLGALTELVSQFEAADDYTQISKAGQPFRVSPLEYAGFFKWLNNFSKGIPNYIQVDNVTGKVTLEKPAQPIKYSYSDMFNRNVLRKLRFAYPFKMFSHPSFEVDDEGNPFYIATTYGRHFFLKEPKVTGLVTLNAMTGATQYYPLNEIPSWVDRVYSSDLLMHQLEMHGHYSNGFFNSLFAKNGVTEPTKGYNYLAIGDDLYMYTGITSVVADESNIGFVLVNMRTKEASMYPLTAAEEFSAMASAEGSLQEKSYTATFPLLINVGGDPLYILTLKDNSGLIKQYALVDAQDYQEVYTAPSVKKLLADYAATNQIEDAKVVDESSLETITGQVENIQATVVDGNSIYYFMVDGQVYRADISLSDRLPFVEEGDDLEFRAGQDGRVVEIMGDFANSRGESVDSSESSDSDKAADPLTENLDAVESDASSEE